MHLDLQSVDFEQLGPFFHVIGSILVLAPQMQLLNHIKKDNKIKKWRTGALFFLEKWPGGFLPWSSLLFLPPPPPPSLFRNLDDASQCGVVGVVELKLAQLDLDLEEETVVLGVLEGLERQQIKLLEEDGLGGHGRKDLIRHGRERLHARANLGRGCNTVQDVVDGLFGIVARHVRLRTKRGKMGNLSFLPNLFFVFFVVIFFGFACLLALDKP